MEKDEPRPIFQTLPYYFFFIPPSALLNVSQIRRCRCFPYDATLPILVLLAHSISYLRRHRRFESLPPFLPIVLSLSNFSPNLFPSVSLPCAHSATINHYLLRSLSHSLAFDSVHDPPGVIREIHSQLSLSLCCTTRKRPEVTDRCIVSRPCVPVFCFLSRLYGILANWTPATLPQNPSISLLYYSFPVLLHFSYNKTFN